MKLNKYALPAAEMLLILPSVLFMTALFVRSIQPLQYEPARSAHQIVNWYAARPPVGLWLLMVAFPLAVFVTGSSTLLRKWKSDNEMRQAVRSGLTIVRTHAETLLVTASTLTAAAVLLIVALHMLAD